MSTSPPNQYATLSECVDDLKAQGYTDELLLSEDNLLFGQEPLDPEEFHVDSFHRFEGESDPADMSVVYAISSDRGPKGLLVGAYGSFASSRVHGLLARLNPEHDIAGGVQPVEPIPPGSNAKIH